MPFFIPILDLNCYVAVKSHHRAYLETFVRIGRGVYHRRSKERKRTILALRVRKCRGFSRGVSNYKEVKWSCLLSIKGLGCWMCSSFYTSPSSLYCWHECWAYCRKAWMGFTSAFVRISMARLWVWCVFLKIRSFLAWEMSIARWLARSVSIGILNRCVHSFRWKMDSWGH